MPYYVQTKHNGIYKNTKYITYCIVVRRGLSQPQVTCTENFVKFGHVVS